MPLIRNPDEAERAVRDWMVSHGFPDARLTKQGADGGVDVDASSAIAQVKAEMTPCGRPVIQQTYGIAVSKGKKPLVFALAGFTGEATTWADANGVALYSFDLQGNPEPVTAVAFSISSGSGITEQFDPLGYRIEHDFGLGQGDWHHFNLALIRHMARPGTKLILANSKQTKDITFMVQLHRQEVCYSIEGGSASEWSSFFGNLRAADTALYEPTIGGWLADADSIEATELLLHPTGVELPMTWQIYGEFQDQNDAIRATFDRVGLSLIDMWMGLAISDGILRYGRG